MSLLHPSLLRGPWTRPHCRLSCLLLVPLCDYVLWIWHQIMSTILKCQVSGLIGVGLRLCRKRKKGGFNYLNTWYKRFRRLKVIRQMHQKLEQNTFEALQNIICSHTSWYFPGQGPLTVTEVHQTEGKEEELKNSRGLPLLCFGCMFRIM